MIDFSLNPSKWIDLHADYLFNYAIARVNDREVAQDIIQDTFFAGLKSKDNFKGQASERTWLVSILKRKIIDHYRKVNSNKGKAESAWLKKDVWDHTKNAEKIMENEELGLIIDNCINKLPPKQFEVFTMKIVKGYTAKDICEKLNISESDVWITVHRARAFLSNCLKKKGIL